MEPTSKSSETGPHDQSGGPIDLQPDTITSEPIAVTDDIPATESTRKITIVEPEKPVKEIPDADEAPVASTSREGSPTPEEEEEEAPAEEDNENNGDFEQDDEQEELEEAYFWHEQIISELQRVCRDGDPTGAYTILEPLSVDRLGRTSYTARAARTGELVVVKSTLLQAPVEKAAGQRLVTELFLMRDMLAHPNVVSFYDLYLVDESEVLLVTEYMQTGVTLGDIIANTASTFTEAQIARICLETCKGLAHLHSQLIIHRDMRSDSIIIDAKGRVKITGLAFSVQLASAAAKRRTMVSSLSSSQSSAYTVDKTHWTAPEIIKRKEYGAEVDVWALGITVLEMLHGAPPYAGEEPLRVLFLILVNGTPEIRDPEARSEEVKDFVGKCLAVDVAERATTEELLEREFLKKACTPEELAPLFEFKPKPDPELEPEEGAAELEPEPAPETGDSSEPSAPAEATEPQDLPPAASTAEASTATAADPAPSVEPVVPDAVASSSELPETTPDAVGPSVPVVESPAAVAANTDTNTNTADCAPDAAPATVDSTLSKEGEGEGGSSGAPQTLKTPTPAPTEVDAPGLSTVSAVPA
ncbi:kinase-like domain-containing protein [Mycena olivaceomarginata]|nr:kinase-like domain-containing protein [Mycena olivaceomarginata]